MTVTIHTAKPGIVIGKGGANVEVLRQQIGALTKRKVKLEIKEIRQPELDADLVAMNIAGQLSRRIAFKKAMKQAIQRSMKAGAKGVKIAVAGRLGGSEMGRREWDSEGRIPLGTLRADISYGQVHAHTTYGRIGVKVWIYRGDVAARAAGAARRRTPPAAAGAGGLTDADAASASSTARSCAAGCPAWPRAATRSPSASTAWPPRSRPGSPAARSRPPGGR